MHKMLSFISLLLSANLLFGQTVKFDLEAGANTSTYSEKESAFSKTIPNFTDAPKSSYTGSFHAGLLAKTALGNWALQTGAIYTVKGGDDVELQQTPGAFSLAEYGHCKLQYTEVPLNITYNIPFDEHTFFIGGGPYMEVIIKGSYNYSYVFTDYRGTTTGTTTVGVPLPTTSYGIHLFEGVEFKNGFSFNVGYEFGLTNVASNGNYTAKNNAVMLSVAYTLFRLKVHHKNSK